MRFAGSYKSANVRENWIDQDGGSTVWAEELPIDLAGSSLCEGAEQILLTHLGQAIYNPFFHHISLFSYSFIEPFCTSLIH